MRIFQDIAEKIQPVKSSIKHLKTLDEKFDKRVKKIMLGNFDLTPDEIAKSLNSPISKIYGSIYRLIVEDKVPRCRNEAKDEVKITREDVRSKKRNAIAMYLDAHPKDPIKINELKDNLKNNNHIEISKSCIKNILGELKENGREVITYREYEIEQTRKAKEEVVQLRVNKEKIIQQVKEMYNKGYFPHQMRNALNFSNDGIITLSNALRILKKRGEIIGYRNKRTNSEITFIDSLFADLYNKHVPAKKIRKDLNLNVSVYNNTIARLKHVGTIQGRRERELNIPSSPDAGGKKSAS